MDQDGLVAIHYYSKVLGLIRGKWFDAFDVSRIGYHFKRKGRIMQIIAGCSKTSREQARKGKIWREIAIFG